MNLIFIFFLSALLLIVVFGSVSAEHKRSELGYPRGLIFSCKGVTNPAEIPRSQLKYLRFVTQGKGRTKYKYNYWNAKNIAKDPRIDFVNRKTMIICIGYLDSVFFPIASMLANLYEDRGYNIIMLDNQRFSTVNYHLASRLMRPVGKHTAEVLVQLVEQGLDPKMLEIVSFSLGSPTMSYIAKSFQQLTGRNISRLTGLEPSGPCYRDLGPADRLTASDADFVQVLHTNIDGYGMANRMGHVDFYVNGGEYQPADLNLYPCVSTCSHFRVLPLWDAVVKNPSKFIAMQCNSIQQARDFECYDNVPMVTNVMGPKIDTTKHGIFFVSTTEAYPYYLGSKGLKKEYAYFNLKPSINENNVTVIYT